MSGAAEKDIPAEGLQRSHVVKAVCKFDDQHANVLCRTGKDLNDEPERVERVIFFKSSKEKMIIRVFWHWARCWSGNIWTHMTLGLRGNAV